MRPDRQSPRAETPEAPLRPHPLLERYYSDEAQRRRQVLAWFDESAVDYDWVTQALSFGSGVRYRREALLRAGLAPGMAALDVACGTGVLAKHAQDIVGADGANGRTIGQAIGLDLSTGMLRQAAARGVRRLVRGRAEALPFPDERFDLLSMGYALRHVNDLRTTFREYRRVLRPGGRALILEITPPRRRLPFWLLKIYLRWIVPLLARFGRRGRSSRELMEYYWDTIESCVPPETLLEALREAGFSRVERHVEMGILSEYTAVR